jgi:hypothetical protein
MGPLWVASALASGGLLPPRPCGTYERLQEAPAARYGTVFAAARRSERDAYDVPNVRTSDHFALRWGNFNGLSNAEADQLLEHFELAWRVQVDEMGHTPPYGTAAFRFNVYVGDTGDGAPGSFGAGGYQTTDIEGWPMVVVARSSFYDAGYLQQTAVHEFYHAIQSETRRFPYDGISAWYWEATAEWAAIEAVPDNPSNGVFVAGYVWRPEVGVAAFDYPDEGTLEEYHQYGAFLFPHDLSSAVGREVVTETWKDTTDEADPLEVMRSLLADRGEDLDDLLLDHVARTVLLDHPLADILEPHLTAFSPLFPGESVVSRGLVGPESGRVGNTAPQRYGSYVLLLRSPPDGVVHVGIEGDALGSEGSPAQFGGRVVVDRDAGPEYFELPFDGTAGSVSVDAGGDDVYVVIGATTPSTRFWDSEHFSFDYELSVDEAEVEPERPSPRPGRLPRRACDQSGAGAGIWLIVSIAASLRRRSAPAPLRAER